jgi:hypothetical protein
MIFFAELCEKSKVTRSFLAVHNIEGSRTPGVEINESVTTRGGGQVVSQGSQMDFNVTSPAAIYALGLVYLQTNEERIANAFHIPGEFVFLEYPCDNLSRQPKEM